MLKIEQDQRPIYNGRPSGRTGPPITIYHQAFAKLKAALRDLTTVVDEARENRLRNTTKLHRAAMEIYDSEEERCKEVIPHLERLLDINLIQKRAVHIDKRATSAEEAVDGAETKAVIALVEFKNEFDGGDCGLQTALRLRKYLAEDALCIFICHNLQALVICLVQYEPIRNASCCPCITMSVAGPYITFGGAILVDSFTVEPFTEYICLGGDPYTEERTALHAQIFAAVSQALFDLKVYYRNLEPTVTPMPYRLFPNPTYLSNKPSQKLTFTSRFHYEGRLSDDYARSLFRANYGEGEMEEEVLVKFCEHYHADGHRKVAAANYAPKLFYCEQILGGVIMVVMKFIDGSNSHYRFKHQVLPPKILDDVRNAVNELHDATLVFGDLRRPNIIIHKTSDGERAMLVDFDWVGQDGEARYPASLNDTGSIIWPAGVKPSGIMRMEHDDEMIKNLVSGR